MSSSSLPKTEAPDQALYWTDDLPVCMLSAVGESTNQIYKEDGSRREEHVFEDRRFHFKVEDIYLYGVFDGHDGCKVANFAAQRMPAELLLGQLKGNISDNQIRQALHQAFISVDKGFFESIDDALAEKAKLMMHVPEGVSYYQASQQCPQLLKQLEDVEKEIKGGTMATVAVIKDKKLYVANAGYCRALMCKINEEGVLTVIQLTKDHDLYNDAELQRLLELGLDAEKIKQAGKLGDYQHTRSLGDYNVKPGYREIEILSCSKSEPVIPVPEVEVIDIDESCKFLILMTNGVYKSLELATATEHVNRDIASMVATEFSQQTTLSGVVQNVVDKIVRQHHDTYLVNVGQRKDMCQQRDDMTLLVRNFNYPLPKAASPTASNTFNPFTSYPSHSSANMSNHNVLAPLSVIIPPGSSPAEQSSLQLQVAPPPSNEPSALLYQTNSRTIMSTNISSTLSSTQRSYTNTSSNDSTQSDDPQAISKKLHQNQTLPLNEDGRVEAYVDFSLLYDAFDKLSAQERKDLDADLEPRPAYETIEEEKEEIECDGYSEEEDDIDGSFEHIPGTVLFT